MNWRPSVPEWLSGGGSYSQAAMRKFFGENVNAFHWNPSGCHGSADEGSADFAVLPIENSTAGIVNEIYDLLVEFEIISWESR